MAPADMWAYKRRRQKEDLASGVNGGWFTREMVQNARILNAPY